MEQEQQLYWAVLDREVVELHDFAELQALGGVIVLGDTSPSKKKPKKNLQAPSFAALPYGLAPLDWSWSTLKTIITAPTGRLPLKWIQS